ncbi:MAG: hypothetical protein PVJ53_15765, partial [Desulfobacterales bacterium]
MVYSICPPDTPSCPRRGWAGLLTTVMIIGAALLLQSCVSVGPDYEVPDLSAPDMWQAQLVQGVSTGETPLETWWRVFNDPVL